MSKNKSTANLLIIVANSIAIYGLYYDCLEQSKSWLPLIILSSVFTLYLVTEYVLPNWNNIIYPTIVRIIKISSVIVVVLFLIYLGGDYLLSGNFTKATKQRGTNTISKSKEPEKPNTQEEKSNIIKISDTVNKVPIIEKPKIASPKRIKTWNEIIRNNDSCNSSVMTVKEINGITELEARKFLTSMPQLNERARLAQTTKNRNPKYLYWTSYSSYEVWNQKEETRQDLNNMKGNYLGRLERNKKGALKWSEDGYKQSLNGYKKFAFTYTDIEPDAPYIVLYHEYGSHKKPGRYDQRFRKFIIQEFHTFIFRPEDVQKLLRTP